MLENILDKVRENKKAVFIVGILALLSLGAYFWMHLTKQETNSLPRLENAPKQVTQPSSSSSSFKNSGKTEEKKPSQVTVDIKGAVKRQGIYTLAADSRVNDLIEKAGGFSKTADRKSVNLAQKLQDEAVVYVASLGENISAIHSETEIASENTASTNQSKVNLNTATVAELQTISGIGEKRAQDIIDYRETNGHFKSIEDLKNISGIGDKTFEKLKDAVSVD